MGWIPEFALFDKHPWQFSLEPLENDLKMHILESLANVWLWTSLSLWDSGSSTIKWGPYYSTVLICSYCHNEVPQVEVLNNKTYCLTILEATSLRSKCQQSGFLLKAMRVTLFNASLLLLVICWQPLAFLGMYISAFTFTWCSSYMVMYLEVLEVNFNIWPLEGHHSAHKMYAPFKVVLRF